MTKDDFLSHHGILGMKWGERRYQNLDGSLTEAGKERYRRVSRSDRSQRAETKRARRYLDKYRKQYAEAESEYKKEAQKHKEQAAEYEDLAWEMGHNKGLLEKKISDIDSGAVKAGRDYVLQSDIYVKPFKVVRTTRFVEKRSPEQIKAAREALANLKR